MVFRIVPRTIIYSITPADKHRGYEMLPFYHQIPHVFKGSDLTDQDYFLLSI
ncbi:unnamed protein product, partial [Ceratitis capitata]